MLRTGQRGRDILGHDLRLYFSAAAEEAPAQPESFPEVEEEPLAHSEPAPRGEPLGHRRDPRGGRGAGAEARRGGSLAPELQAAETEARSGRPGRGRAGKGLRPGEGSGRDFIFRVRRLLKQQGRKHS